MKSLFSTLLIFFLAGPAMAETDGAIAKRLSQELLCDTYNIISGNLGLLLGFLIAAWGLYLWIAKDSMRTGLIYIICGALLTALPGLIINSLQGAFIATSSLRGEGNPQPLLAFRNACNVWPENEH